VVPRPEITIDQLRLETGISLIASGTARNILEAEEELCVLVEVKRAGQSRFNRCFPATVIDKKWSVREQVPSVLIPGDNYVVQIGLAPRGYAGEFRPDGFFALARASGRV
jgi:hypothetical protein